jgi:NAD(P)-dependent dehydrogenase (short-subunit alcohol dehydrogenase family)
LELDGKVALVTGAGTRVGRAIAVALGKAGMRVGVHYYGSEKGARGKLRMKSLPRAAMRELCRVT